MSYEYSLMMEDLAEGALVFGGASFFSGGLIKVAVYVFTALSLYHIASRRGISRAWLAWVPVINVWTLGSISDQYRYVVRQETRSKRKWLLILSIIQSVLYGMVLVFGFVLAGNVIYCMVNSVGQHQMVSRIMAPLLSIVTVCVPLVGVAIGKAILYYMALYDVYTSCDRKNKGIYLVLSILPVVSTITKPLFLFLCRDQDEGMPPRKNEEPAFVSEEVPLWEQPEAPEPFVEE